MTEGVFFDLDGTLADTAPDLARAINRVLADHGRTPLPLQALRPHVSSGARGMLRAAFGISPEDPQFQPLARQFLDHYASALCVETRLFEGMHALLEDLESAEIPWGIITNKQSRFTEPLVAALALHERACCVISGDTATRPKPAPDPLLLACERTGLSPHNCLYVGDDPRDIIAGQAAGMRTIAVSYGYLGVDQPIDAWGADEIIHAPQELATLIGLQRQVRDSMDT